MPSTPQCLGSKGYMFILMACLPVILCQSPISSPSESPKPSPDQVCADAVYPLECKEMLKSADGDCKKALISNIKAMKVKISETMTTINKTLPSLVGDENVTTCVSQTKKEYNYAIRAFEGAMKGLEKNDESYWEPGNQFFDVVKMCYEQFPASHPFEKENEVLYKMAGLNEDLSTGIVWVQQQDE